MSFALFLKTLWREARGARGRSLFFVSCVAVGVAAVVGVAALTEAVEVGIRMRSRELLGGDIALESQRPLPDVRAFLPGDRRGAATRTVQLSILPSMVRSPSGASRLVEIKAVDAAPGDFPLAGELTLSPARPFDQAIDDGSVLVAPEILEGFGLALGESLVIGSQTFRIAGLVTREPDPLTFSFTLGPRVLMTKRALARTGLLGFGSRMRYRSLLALPAGTSDAELAEVKRGLQERFPGGGSYVSIETRAEAQPALRSTLQRVQSYLGLVALLSLLMASVGVAQIVSAWLARATPNTAILRCLGVRPREVLALYLGQVLLLALAGSGVGAAIGAALPGFAARAYPELIPAGVSLARPVMPVLHGVSLGVGVALLFSLPALTAIWEVSPARVLRSEAAPLPVPPGVRAAAIGLAALGVFGAAWLQGKSLMLALGFGAGVAALACLLWLGARALLWGVARLPRERMPAIVWQGAAALARPGSGAVGSVVALGMGALVVLGISLVQNVLDQEIRGALPDAAPSVFLLDIQPDQWAGVQQICSRMGARNIQSVPVIMARLAAVDGRSVDQLVKERPGDPNERGRAHWVLTREQRVTSMRELPADNRIVDGALWSNPTAREVSLEEEFARDVGAKVGSTLRFDVQGVPMDFVVTSLRSVRWRSFSMNFFIVAEPGTLDAAPQIRLGGARLPASAEQQLQNELARTYPNISVLRVQHLLARAAGLLGQVGVAVRLLGGFAMLTGLIILAGAIASSQLRRAREAALLKALGLSRLRIVALFGLEYALGGSVAGLLGAAGSYVLTTVFVQRVLELSAWPAWHTCAIAVVLCALLAVAAGLAASARALMVRPLEVLREQG